MMTPSGNTRAAVGDARQPPFVAMDLVLAMVQVARPDGRKKGLVGS